MPFNNMISRTDATALIPEDASTEILKSLPETSIVMQLARLLMVDPALILLDEPTAGVNPVLIEELMARVRELNRRGVTEAMYEAISQGDRDFSALISRMKAARIEVMYFGGYHTEAGLLIDLRASLRNEVHEDFLEQAEAFLSETTPVPDSLKSAATVLAGGVLEDQLRKLAERKGVQISGHSTISKLNEELYRAKVYEKTEMKQVTLWGDYRNNAAHHKPGDVPIDQVKPMIDGIRAFILRHIK